MIDVTICKASCIWYFKHDHDLPSLVSPVVEWAQNKYEPIYTFTRGKQGIEHSHVLLLPEIGQRETNSAIYWWCGNWHSEIPWRTISNMIFIHFSLLTRSMSSRWPAQAFPVVKIPNLTCTHGSLMKYTPRMPGRQAFPNELIHHPTRKDISSPGPYHIFISMFLERPLDLQLRVYLEYWC
jgi:hypothetical protein